MRYAWTGLMLSVVVATVSLGACASSSKTIPTLGAGGDGGDDGVGSGNGNGNGNVTSTGSGQVCGSVVGPNVPAQCPLCQQVSGAQGVGGSTGSFSASNGVGGDFPETVSSTGSSNGFPDGGVTCQANGCLGGLWCDTSTKTCEQAPVCNNTTATTGGFGGNNNTVTTGNTTGQGAASNVSSSSGGSCAHDVCTQGNALLMSCSSCTETVCAKDSYCCTTAWDSGCVGEATSLCGVCSSTANSSSVASTGSGACLPTGFSCNDDLQCCSDFCDVGICG